MFFSARASCSLPSPFSEYNVIDITVSSAKISPVVFSAEELSSTSTSPYSVSITSPVFSPLTDVISMSISALPSSVLVIEQPVETDINIINDKMDIFLEILIVLPPKL